MKVVNLLYISKYNAPMASKRLRYVFSVHLWNVFLDNKLQRHDIVFFGLHKLIHDVT